MIDKDTFRGQGVGIFSAGDGLDEEAVQVSRRGLEDRGDDRFSGDWLPINGADQAAALNVVDRRVGAATGGGCEGPHVIRGHRLRGRILVQNLIVLDGGGAGFTGEEICRGVEDIAGGPTGGGTGVIATDGAEDIEEAVGGDGHRLAEVDGDVGVGCNTRGAGTGDGARHRGIGIGTGGSEGPGTIGSHVIGRAVLVHDEVRLEGDRAELAVGEIVGRVQHNDRVGSFIDPGGVSATGGAVDGVPARRQGDRLAKGDSNAGIQGHTRGIGVRHSGGDGGGGVGDSAACHGDVINANRLVIAIRICGHNANLDQALVFSRCWQCH